jgi:DNA-binding transcriptional ArsR family regulator
MSSSEPLERFVKFFKALGDENRIRIVGLLSHKPHSVEELAANLSVTSATVSHHLQRLQQADLVEARAQGHTPARYQVSRRNLVSLSRLRHDRTYHTPASAPCQTTCTNLRIMVYLRLLNLRTTSSKVGPVPLFCLGGFGGITSLPHGEVEGFEVTAR